MATALEATANGGIISTASSLTVDIAPAGTDRLLLVFVSLHNTIARTVSSVTFGAAAMTEMFMVQTEAGGASRIYLWGLVAPATGNDTITATLSGNMSRGLIGAFAISGATQSLTPESSDTFQGKANTITTDLTVAATSGAFVVGGALIHTGGDPGLAANFTAGWDLVETGLADNYRHKSSYDANTGAGTLNPFTNAAIDDNVGAIAVSIAQAVAAVGGRRNNLSLLGVS